jgi:3-vinyl bacteriochlorophyllide hydratase
MPLYTPEERQRRDGSRWTLVQGVLAPVQFLVFLVSLALVLRFLATGQGEQAATLSIVVKTLVSTWRAGYWACFRCIPKLKCL